jgi:beta-lactam-binding protein with PASTA domain
MTTMESETPHMPMVLGLDPSAAREVIISVLTDPQISVEHRDTDVVPPGSVFVQKPPAGLHVSPGSQIRLTVSTGPTAGDLSSSEP